MDQKHTIRKINIFEVRPLFSSKELINIREKAKTDTLIETLMESILLIGEVTDLEYGLSYLVSQDLITQNTMNNILKL